MQRMQKSREVSLRPCCQRKEGAGEKRTGGDGTGREGWKRRRGVSGGGGAGAENRSALSPGPVWAFLQGPGAMSLLHHSQWDGGGAARSSLPLALAAPRIRTWQLTTSTSATALPPTLSVLPGCTRRPPCLLPNGGRGTKKKKKRMTVVAVTDAVIEEESNGGGGGRVVRRLR